MELKDYLKDKGLRVTQARIDLYELLKLSPKAMNAKELHEELQSTNEAVDLVSIYRNLATFEELHLVHKLQDGRYQVCQQKHHHHSHIHVLFHCLECGATEELSHDDKNFCKAVENIQSKSKLAGQFTQFTLSGICKACS